MPEQTETEGLVPFWDHVYELTRRLKAWLYSFVIATVLFLVLPGDDAFLHLLNAYAEILDLHDNGRERLARNL